VARSDEASIIAVDKFIQATRDSGYKGTDSAVAELVDNALQAGARNVAISISDASGDPKWPLRVSVLDDGCGMDRTTLRQALRFGGSSRFNDRSGFGRYGMGLPNSSLSQARHLDVFTWRRPKSILCSYLDVDEIADRKMTVVPEPEPASLPNWCREPKSTSGTMVIWTGCDRLDHRRVSTLVRKLSGSLGRVFRYFLWDGVRILVNGTVVQPTDPLYVAENAPTPGGRLFCEPVNYQIEARSSNGTSDGVGTVVIRFTELPVHAWHGLSNDEKRELGIANGAGVSVVRANREIDFGWFFMGRKRRENYDDWWRCEVRFDPILDEAFGITHTKQQIRPQEYLLEILSPDVENMAKALNSRVRQAHLEIQASERVADVERLVGERDHLLRPLPRPKTPDQQVAMFDQLAKRHPAIKDGDAAGVNGSVRYRIVEDRMKDTCFYSFVAKDSQFVLVLNPDHPFYRTVYRPLVESDKKESGSLRQQIDLLLLSAARAEALATSAKERDALTRQRRVWSDTLATLLNG
jgi:anti-sigma regulatory factor (Ser/Thr protein kinase)